MPDAPIGGQAVLEGVMMRGVRTWAVAMRRPDDGEIELQAFPLRSRLQRPSLWRLPVLRGVVALVESLGIGIKALKLSTNLQMGEEDEEISAPQWALAVVLGLLLAVVLFFVVPVAITSLFKDSLSSVTFWLVEGLLRTAIFLGYLVAVTRLRDLRRLFEYHGAEHKTISCHEAGLELTPENAQRFSRLHPRCGTSFLLIVMIVAIFAFAPIGLPEWYWLIATRVLGIPLIAGVSFEIIKATGRRRDEAWAKIVMWPGMQLQRLTTREPDAEQLTVAIAALQAVLDDEPADHAAGELIGVEVAA